MTQPIPGIITLQALTFLHPGTGQTTGVVDLPVQREVHSGHPMYTSSGFKGSLRDKAEQKWSEAEQKPDVTTLFGSEAGATEGERTVAGALAITDGRILALPVRSLQHVFVWVTCPMIINRLNRDAGLINLPFLNDLPSMPPAPAQDTAWVDSSAGFIDPLILEELAFTVQTENDQVGKIGQAMKSLAGESGFDPARLVLIPDEDFSYFAQHATQVSARIKLNKRKTTTGDGGNLWYEETLPPETILYAFILCHKPRNPDNGITEAVGVAEKLTNLCQDKYLQIGGNETVGQGWCHVNLRIPNQNGEDAHESDT